MLTWIITGGVACGKSTLCQWLAKRIPGTSHFDADACVRSLLATNEVRTCLLNAFGPLIFTPLGEVDRAKLRDLIFEEPKKRIELQEILHPLVFAACDEQKNEAAAHTETPFFIAEIPLYFETGKRYPNELVVTVAISPELQRERLLARSTLDEVTVERILSAQLPIMDKVQLADVVVWNQGPIESMERQAHLLIQHHFFNQQPAKV